MQRGSASLVSELAVAAWTHQQALPLDGEVPDAVSGLGPESPKDLFMAKTVVVSLVTVGFITLLTCYCAMRSMRRGTAVGKIMSLVVEETRLLVPATVCLFFSSGLQMAIPYFGGQFIDMISRPEGISDERLSELMVQILVSSVLMSVTAMIRGALYQLAGERIVCRLRKRVFASLMQQEIAFFDEQTSGALVSRIASDTATMQSAGSSWISMGLRSLATIVMSLAILLAISWKLTLTMLGVVPAVSVLANVMMRLTRKTSKRYQEETAEAGKVAGEALGSMRTVRSFRAGEGLMLRRFNKAADETFRWGRKNSWIYGAWSGVVGMLFFIAFTVVLWVGARLVKAGDIKVADMVSFILYTTQLSMSITMLGGIMPQMGSTVGATQKIFSLLEREPLMKDGTVDPGEECSGLVMFEDVSFAYATRPDAKVLDSVSFTVKPNQTVALVGQSGSGKSSSISLLMRLYDVTSGCVSIDGHDVRNLRRDYLRRHIAVVSQEPVLFAGSARENILFGVEDATDEQMESAAKLANCHDFLSDFQEKYDTLVGERGIQLSGGQKQRVAIARALLLKPAILLLDEATSALDAESERIVQDALNSLIDRRTGGSTIVVAHRLSTVRNADLIVVFGAGAIKESGSHDELIKLSGVYKELVSRQLEEAK